MNRKERIKSIICNFFPKYEISVIDESIKHQGHNNFDGTQETHFKIILKNKEKVNLKKIEIHRKINALLSEEFLNGLHALEINIEN